MTRGMSLAESLEVTLSAAGHLADPMYEGLKALTLTVAEGIDAAKACGDLTRVGTLTYRLTVLLRELRLTPDTAPGAPDNPGDFIEALLNGATP